MRDSEGWQSANSGVAEKAVSNPGLICLAIPYGGSLGTSGEEAFPENDKLHFPIFFLAFLGNVGEGFWALASSNQL